MPGNSTELLMSDVDENQDDPPRNQIHTEHPRNIEDTTQLISVSRLSLGEADAEALPASSSHAPDPARSIVVRLPPRASLQSQVPQQSTSGPFLLSAEAVHSGHFTLPRALTDRPAVTQPKPAPEPAPPQTLAKSHSEADFEELRLMCRHRDIRQQFEVDPYETNSWIGRLQLNGLDVTTGLQYILRGLHTCLPVADSRKSAKFCIATHGLKLLELLTKTNHGPSGTMDAGMRQRKQKVMDAIAERWVDKLFRVLENRKLSGPTFYIYVSEDHKHFACTVQTKLCPSKFGTSNLDHGLPNEEYAQALAAKEAVAWYYLHGTGASSIAGRIKMSPRSLNTEARASSPAMNTAVCAENVAMGPPGELIHPTRAAMLSKPERASESSELDEQHFLLAGNENIAQGANSVPVGRRAIHCLQKNGNPSLAAPADRPIQQNIVAASMAQERVASEPMQLCRSPNKVASAPIATTHSTGVVRATRYEGPYASPRNPAYEYESLRTLASKLKLPMPAVFCAPLPGPTNLVHSFALLHKSFVKQCVFLKQHAAELALRMNSATASDYVLVAIVKEGECLVDSQMILEQELSRLFKLEMHARCQLRFTRLFNPRKRNIDAISQ